MTGSKPLRLFFIRHGQTENHDNPPFNGWRDAPLTPLGERQLDQMAAGLADIPFEAVYSSDLSRAVYGGRRLAELNGRPLVQDPQWREMSFGRWEGLNYQQICEDDPELAHKILAHDGDDLPFPGGGESSAGFARRVGLALDDLWQKHPEGGRVALVAHGGVCKMIWARLLKLNPNVAWQTIRQDFAAVNVADIYQSGYCLAHLVNGYLGPEGYHKAGPGFELLKGDNIFEK